MIHDPADAGYYSGLAEGAFAVAQLMTGGSPALTVDSYPLINMLLISSNESVFPAAWISDIYGRKPVLIIGTAGVGISMGVFGFSTKFWMILAFRLLGGTVAGSRTVQRVMGSEMAHSRDEEAWIFTLITIFYRIGQATGQPIGALLSHPERRWPEFRYPFWRMYPYVLPCLFGAAYALVTALFAQIVLKETLASKRREKERKANDSASAASEATPLLAGNSEGVNATEASIGIPPPNPMSPTTDTSSISSIMTQPLISVFLSALGTATITEIFYAVYPLYAFTPVELGGLGLSEARIGIQLSVRAVLFIGSLFIYTPVWKSVGRMETHRLSILMWLPTTALFPVLNWVARGHAGGEGGLFWYLVLIVLFVMWSTTGWVWRKYFELSY